MSKHSTGSVDCRETTICGTTYEHLHQCRCSFETHDGNRLSFPSSWQPVEGGAGAGEGAERRCAGRDGRLRDTQPVYVFHRTEGTAPRQGVDDLDGDRQTDRQAVWKSYVRVASTNAANINKKWTEQGGLGYIGEINKHTHTHTQRLGTQKAFFQENPAVLWDTCSTLKYISKVKIQ